MNFIEAVKEIRKGTMVRRKSFPYMDIFEEKYKLGHILIKGLHSEHIEATDWEIVEEDWNLANQLTPGQYWNLAEKENISKKYGNWNVEHFFWKDDVKKCREVIIKDLSTQYTPVSKNTLDIIKKRFGDL